LVLAIGGLAIVVLWWIRPGDGPVRLLEPTPNPGDAFTYAGTFPPADGTPLRNPRGIDVTEDAVFVAAADQGAVVVYGIDGRRIAELPVPAPPGMAAYPVDVAVMSGGRIAVADTTAKRVVVLTLDDQLAQVTTSTVLGTGARRPESPTAVAADAESLYVADAGAGAVLVYSADGEFRETLGEGLVPAMTFAGGLGLRGDRLWLSDSTSGRVLWIDAAADVQGGSLAYDFDLPRGLSVDSVAGRVAVVDVFARRLTVFTADGEERGSTDGRGMTGGSGAQTRLERPEGVAWSPHGSRVYVTDSGSGTVKVFNVVPLP